jgi:hypothetical protein
LDSAVAGGSEAGAPTPARFPQPMTVPGPHGGSTINDDAQVKHTAQMVQVLVGYGISREYPVEKYARDARLLIPFVRCLFPGPEMEYAGVIG